MNHWQKHFGASRRAIDRKILAECEKTICQADLREIELDVEREERMRAKDTWSKVDPGVDRVAIAKAFGRPIS